MSDTVHEALDWLQINFRNMVGNTAVVDRYFSIVRAALPKADTADAE